jgi:hypothetical protein
VRSYLIRVQLPDRPGALGAVASRIGSVGGDVVSIDILQRDDGVVVDEVGVGLAGEHLVDLVRDEILEVDGVSIESVRPVEGAMPDRTAELLDITAELLTQTSPTGLLDQLTGRVRQGLAADYAVVVDGDGTTVVAGSGQPPDRVDPDAGAQVGPHVAVAPMVDLGRTLVVGRDDPVLRERERQWVVTMAKLADYGRRDLP